MANAQKDKSRTSAYLQKGLDEQAAWPLSKRAPPTGQPARCRGKIPAREEG